jgi:hypothetical protein
MSAQIDISYAKWSDAGAMIGRHLAHLGVGPRPYRTR